MLYQTYRHVGNRLFKNTCCGDRVEVTGQSIGQPHCVRVISLVDQQLKIDVNLTDSFQ